MDWHSRKMWTQFLTVIIGLKAVFENCPQLTIHCSYYSMATIYAIEIIFHLSKLELIRTAPKPSWIVQAPAITETSEVPQPMDMWP